MSRATYLSRKEPNTAMIDDNLTFKPTWVCGYLLDRVIPRGSSGEWLLHLFRADYRRFFEREKRREKRKEEKKKKNSGHVVGFP